MSKKFASIPSRLLHLTKINTERDKIYFYRGLVNVVFIIYAHNSRLNSRLNRFHLKAAGFIYPRESTPKTQLIAHFYISLPQEFVLLRDTQK